MLRTHCLKRGARSVRWAGLLAAALFAAGAAADTGDSAEEELSPEAAKVVFPKPQAEVVELAKRDPLALLRLSLEWYEQNVTGYTATFQKQERVGDKLLKTETMHMKFREDPFSVYLKWTANPSKGQEVIYEDDKHDGKAVVHPSGLIGMIFRKVLLDPEGKIATRHSRRPINYAGMANMLRVIIPQCEGGREAGDQTLEYLGIQEEGERPTYVIKRTLPEKPEYPSEHLFIYIDTQFLLPVRTEAYLWDGSLLSDYKYTDLEINPGLTDDDFDPDNKDYGFRLL
jgi:hypothetical protein